MRNFTAIVLVVLTLTIIPACGGSSSDPVATPKTWGTPVALEENTSSNYEPRVVDDNNGTVIVVWQERETVSSDLTMANRYTAATGWVGAEQISDSSATNKGYPEIASGGGKTFVIWTQDSEVVVNHFDSATDTWGTPETISTTTAGFYVGDVEIVVDGSGNATAIWREFSGDNQAVVTNRYDAAVPSGSWGTTSELDSFTSNRAAVPAVAMDAAGNSIAIWQVGNDIMAKHYDSSSGNWDVANTPLEIAAGAAWYPEIAMNGTGDAIVVWYQWDGTTNNIMSNQYIPGSGWQGAVLIESYDVDAYFPQVAINVSGTAMVVWYAYNSPDDEIWANIYTPATGWGTEEQINQVVGGNHYDPRVAMNDNGDGVVVWDHEAAVTYTGNIMANRYSSSSGWGVAESIDDPNYDSWYPYVAIDAAGNATAVWEQDMGNYDMMAVRLE